MIQRFMLLISFASFSCFALDEQPADFYLSEAEVESKRQKSLDLLSLQHVYQIPEKTYHYLANIFSGFYQTLSFDTSVTDSTFAENAHYQLLAIPLIASNSQKIQFEFFANFSNRNTQHLSNVSSDNSLFHYIAHEEQFNRYNSDMAIGAGLRFPTSDTTLLKIVISNKQMPGYGNSTALLGFESKF